MESQASMSVKERGKWVTNPPWEFGNLELGTVNEAQMKGQQFFHSIILFVKLPKLGFNKHTWKPLIKQMTPCNDHLSSQHVILAR